MDKAKSIKEIAQLAGVSVATVSRVINHNGRFSPETERRVRSIIAENEYIPNMNAKGLRTSRTQVVGIIVPDITNPHFSDLVLKLEMSLFERGYSSLICNTNESTELERRHIQSLTAQNVSGIILISGTRDYEELGDLPVIYVDRPSIDLHETGIMIESDNEKGGYLATRELLSQGCRRILMLKSIGSDCNQLNRYKGYQRALAQFGIAEEKRLQVDLGEVTTDAARAIVSGLLDSGLAFDGVMCTTDTIAAGVVIALREHGLKVPGDILVTGFDDCRIAAMCGPGLTSVRQNVDEMARIATELFLRLQRGEPVEHRSYRLPVSLTVRASTRRAGAPQLD